jgi:predicted GNAT family acetyltransferase
MRPEGTLGGVTLRLTDNPDEARYEAWLDDELAGFSAYRLTDGQLTFTHTEVKDAHEGQGVGSALARYALDDARGRGLAVDPRCPFIASWIERHPDYADLVRASHTNPRTGSTSGTNP